MLITAGGDLEIKPDEQPDYRRALTGEAFSRADLSFANPDAMIRRLIAFGVIRPV